MGTGYSGALIHEDVSWGNKTNKKTGENSGRWHSHRLEHLMHSAWGSGQTTNVKYVNVIWAFR